MAYTCSLGRSQEAENPDDYHCFIKLKINKISTQIHPTSGHFDWLSWGPRKAYTYSLGQPQEAENRQKVAVTWRPLNTE